MNLLTLNIFKGTRDKKRFQKIINFVKTQDPDVLCLSELNGMGTEVEHTRGPYNFNKEAAEKLKDKDLNKIPSCSLTQTPNPINQSFFIYS